MSSTQYPDGLLFCVQRVLYLHTIKTNVNVRFPSPVAAVVQPWGKSVLHMTTDSGFHYKWGGLEFCSRFWKTWPHTWAWADFMLVGYFKLHLCLAAKLLIRWAVWGPCVPLRMTLTLVGLVRKDLSLFGAVMKACWEMVRPALATNDSPWGTV